MLKNNMFIVTYIRCLKAKNSYDILIATYFDFSDTLEILSDRLRYGMVEFTVGLITRW
jgi:hypothetical protein